MKNALSSICKAIGNTPIIRLNRLGTDMPHEIYVKCEFMNPGGSIKDRIGFYLIEQAEQRGLLHPGGTIVEATAGNTGMGLAMAAAQKGYRLIVVMTTKMSKEKVDLMYACGAEVVVVPYEVSPDNPNAFINRAKRIAAGIPNAWYVDQFYNSDNFAAHYFHTGPEIWQQTGGELDVLVAGVGTGGTLCGAGAYLKEKKPSIKLVMADPEGSILKDFWETGRISQPRPYLVEGIGGDFIPGNANLDLVDEAIRVTDREAVKTTLQLFQTEGIFAGGSSGCIVAAALRFCTIMCERGLKVLAILPDGGRSYLSTIYNSKWQEKHGMRFSNPVLSPSKGARVCM